jgi:hypothetical protein
MNTSERRPRLLDRFLSATAIGALSATGILFLSPASPASAATTTVTIDLTVFNRTTNLFADNRQTISFESTTITVDLADVIASVEYDTESASLDGTPATVTRQGTTATITVPASFWDTHPVDGGFDLTLRGSDASASDPDGDPYRADVYMASYLVSVGVAGGGATSINSDNPTHIDTLSVYQPSMTVVPVAEGDTVVLDADAGFWTEGPIASPPLASWDTSEDSVQISSDGSTATVAVGPSRQADSPTDDVDLSVTAFSDLDADAVEGVMVLVPIEFPTPAPDDEQVARSER